MGNHTPNNGPFSKGLEISSELRVARINHAHSLFPRTF